MKEVEFLVIDDDRLFCTRLVKAIHDRGYANTLGVESVQAALEILEDSDIDVQRVILDLRIGGESGMKVLEKLSTSESSPEVVVLTGYGSIATATTAMKLGAVNFLTKPVSVEQILLAFEEGEITSEISVPSLSQVEWEHIQRVMSDCDGNVSKAAKALGMHRRSLQRKLQKSPGELH